MPLSLNEIKDRALAFSLQWEGARAERAEAQTFWNEFFNIFGVSRRRLASFEEPVRRAKSRFEQGGGKGGFIDLFWRGTLIAEHKSFGKNLDTAYQQALEYFEGLAERDLPQYIIVSDFARIRLYDLDTDWPDHPRLASSAPPPKLGGGRGVVASIEEAAQSVLDARAAHPEATLADLYDPVAMPPDLRKAHQALDKAVDAAYGKKTFTSDAERVAFLFELYHKYTSLLPGPEKGKRTRKTK